jgi:cystathionine beta-lyase/cystathionine gamma-synthase
MKRHCENAMIIAKYLSKHKKIKKVFYPGLDTDKYHKIAKDQMNDFGGMISFKLKEEGKEAAFKVLEKFKVFTLAESLGGVESLANHPVTMTHASIPQNERERIGITDSLIRLSVGIEDIEDLIDDLKQALG